MVKALQILCNFKRHGRKVAIIDQVKHCSITYMMILHFSQLKPHFTDKVNSSVTLIERQWIEIEEFGSLLCASYIINKKL